MRAIYIIITVIIIVILISVLVWFLWPSKKEAFFFDESCDKTEPSIVDWYWNCEERYPFYQLYSPFKPLNETDSKISFDQGTPETKIFHCS